jgi:hypothetical protein
MAKPKTKALKRERKPRIDIAGKAPAPPEDEAANIKREAPVDMGKRGEVTGAKRGQIPAGAKQATAQQKKYAKSTYLAAIGHSPPEPSDIEDEPGDPADEAKPKPKRKRKKKEDYDAVKRRLGGHLGEGKLY